MKQKILFLFISLCLYLFMQGQTPFPGQTLPDNIVNADCYIAPPSTEWSIKLLAKSPDDKFVNTCSAVLTGDVDGDGEVELVVQNNGDLTTFGKITQIYIYGYNKVTESLYLKYTIDVPLLTEFPFGNITLANVNGDKYASVFYTSVDGYLYKYDFDTGSSGFTQSWRKQYSSVSGYKNGVPIVADFNNHGRAQVNVYDKIYDAITGELLVDAGFLGNSSYSFGLVGHGLYGGGTNYSNGKMLSMHVGDIDGNGTLELVGGDCVYKITIADPINNSASNKFELLRRADSSGRTDIKDGGTALVDMDLDGQLDVVVTANRGAGYASVYIYDPRTGDIMHDNQMDDIPTNGYHGPSMPFVGDIDGNPDGYPEIALTALRTLRTYRLNTQTNKLELFWSLTTADVSASTTLTLFDFNQKGYAQLVYRDEDNLRIIDGRAGISDADRVLVTFESVRSLTVNEYPTVADINGDGQSEIIVTGGATKVMGGSLQVFSSGDRANHPWAPARSVWNTNTYNAVNVNQDLTIPKYHLNPATVFPGSGAGVVRPFNNFLQQQTILNQDGTPLWLAPNGQIVDAPLFSYDDDNDEMTITVQVENIGEAAFQSPFWVTVYKNVVGDPISKSYEYQNTIAIGETATITFTIEDFKADGWIPYNFLLLKINDNGDGTNHQTVCDDSQGQYRYRGLLPTQQDVCLKKAKEINITCCFTLSSSGNDSYKWQVSRDGLIWPDDYISGATGISYIPATQKRGTMYYRVEVTDNDTSEKVFSEPAKIRLRSCQLPVNHNISVMGYHD